MLQTSPKPVIPLITCLLLSLLLGQQVVFAQEAKTTIRGRAEGAGGTAITGNLEMPALLKTIPWQRPKRVTNPSFTPLAEQLEPIDPDLLQRKAELRDWAERQAAP